jgi:hypothetical protein
MRRTVTGLLALVWPLLSSAPAVVQGRTYPSVEATTASWFEGAPQQPPPPDPGQRTGNVSIDGRAFRDDGGLFKGFGVTYFSALFWERVDRGYLQANLDWLSARGVNYIRSLAMVGRTDDPDDFWKDREIDPEAGDYFVIFDDLFADVRARGLRLQVVLVDDVLAMQSQGDRLAWLETMAPYLERHRDRVQFVEVMNESGRKISDGDLAELTRHWQAISDIPVAPSSPGPGSAEDSITELFRDYDLTSDLLTPHFDRNPGEEGYRPHRQPWEVQFYDQVNTHAFVNNEPIGCGSSVATDCDPARLAMGMANTFISRGAGFLFHLRAGVRGDYPFSEERNAEAIMTALRGMMALLPETIANGTPCRHHWDCHPYITEDEIWPDTGGAGIVRAFSSEVDGTHYVAVLGTREHYPVVARWPMTVEVFDARDTTQRLEVVDLEAGEHWTFRQLGELRDFLHRITPR